MTAPWKVPDPSKTSRSRVSGSALVDIDPVILINPDTVHPRPLAPVYSMTVTSELLEALSGSNSDRDVVLRLPSASSGLVSPKDPLRGSIVMKHTTTENNEGDHETETVFPMRLEEGVIPTKTMELTESWKASGAHTAVYADNTDDNVAPSWKYLGGVQGRFVVTKSVTNASRAVVKGRTMLSAAAAKARPTQRLVHDFPATSALLTSRPMSTSTVATTEILNGLNSSGGVEASAPKTRKRALSQSDENGDDGQVDDGVVRRLKKANTSTATATGPVDSGGDKRLKEPLKLSGTELRAVLLHSLLVEPLGITEVLERTGKLAKGKSPPAAVPQIPSVIAALKRIATSVESQRNDEDGVDGGVEGVEGGDVDGKTRRAVWKLKPGVIEEAIPTAWGWYDRSQAARAIVNHVKAAPSSHCPPKLAELKVVVERLTDLNDLDSALDLLPMNVAGAKALATDERRRILEMSWDRLKALEVALMDCSKVMKWFKEDGVKDLEAEVEKPAGTRTARTKTAKSRSFLASGVVFCGLFVAPMVKEMSKRTQEAFSRYKLCLSVHILQEKVSGVVSPI